MKRILSIAGRLVRTQYSEPKAFVPLLLLPLVFAFIFGTLIFGSRSGGSTTELMPVAYVVQEDSALATALRAELAESPLIEPIDYADATAAQTAVTDVDVVAAVTVPTGFEQALLGGKDPTLLIDRQEGNNVYPTVSNEIARAIRRVASAVAAADLGGNDRYSSAWQADFDAALARWRDAAADVAVLDIAHPESPVKQGNVTSIGFCIMFVMISVMVAAGAFLEERVAGTWQRLLATPASRAEIILGYMLGFFISGWIQFAILIVATRTFFGVNWGDPLGLIAISSAFIITSTAIGLALAGVVRTPQQQSVYGDLVVVASSMIAGIYIPHELLPPLVRKIALVLPQYWAVKGYTDLIIRGRGLAALGQPLLVLLGMSAVLLAFGISRIRFE